MKKMLCLALCLILALGLLTGCSSDAKVELAKTVWGISPEQAAEIFGVTELEPQVEESSGLRFGQLNYYYPEAKLDGKPVGLYLMFASSGEGTAYCLLEYRYIFEKQKDADKLHKALTADAEYLELGSYAGYRGYEALSKADADWLTKYTKIFFGEKGIYFGRTMTANGADYRVDRKVSADEEQPLILISQKSAPKPTVSVSSSVYHILNSQKAAYEAWCPDGIPVAKE